ncbi:YybH family protein [Phragmitibacter flavus]|nr:nuclear transport factor 2 family protein [Phragmitibacter flavus]
MSPEDLVVAYEKALASQKWEAVEPLMDSRCTVTFSDGSVHRGIKEVEKAFRRNFALIEDEKYAISELHWMVKSDGFAVCTFVFEWSGRMEGQAVAGSGRGTWSMLKDGGTWKLVAEHLGPKAEG